jgi:hypothetical protein
MSGDAVLCIGSFSTPWNEAFDRADECEWTELASLECECTRPVRGTELLVLLDRLMLLTAIVMFSKLNPTISPTEMT